MNKKILLSSTVLLILISFQSYSTTTTALILGEFTAQPSLNNDIPYFENTVYITWDGVNFKWLEYLMENGTLVNTNRVLGSNGYLQTVRVTSHYTSTDPGVATLECGYGPDINNIPYNMFGPGTIKASIPDGYTIGERLKASLGSDIKLGYAFSWSYHQVNEDYMSQNGNNTDPIFENIRPGTEADYWFAAENLSWVPGDPESIEAAFHYYNETSGMYSSPVMNAAYVAERATDWLVNVTDDRFYLRVHFTEPDQAGHGYGEAEVGMVTPEYMQSLIECDIATGTIFDVLENAGVLDKTLFIIGTDHGMYNGNHGGSQWPAQTDQISSTTFVINNDTVMHPEGAGIPVHQKDIAPTILASMGINMATITPAYIGDKDTGQEFWKVADLDIPEIITAYYKATTDTSYTEITRKTKIEGDVDIKLAVYDWCMGLNATLQVGDQIFVADEATYKNIQWFDIDFSSIEEKTSKLIFTVTDPFGNSETSTIKAAPISIWFSIAGLFVVGTVLYLRRKRT